MRRNDNVLIDSRSQSLLPKPIEANNSQTTVKKQTQEFKVPKPVAVSSRIKAVWESNYCFFWGY